MHEYVTNGGEKRYELRDAEGQPLPLDNWSVLLVLARLANQAVPPGTCYPVSERRCPTLDLNISFDTASFNAGIEQAVRTLEAVTFPVSATVAPKALEISEAHHRKQVEEKYGDT